MEFMPNGTRYPCASVSRVKFAIGAWLYNEAYEFFFGRRPALDVADMAFGFAADVADPELDFADALMGAGEKIAENTPFIGGLLGGGRVPISSAMPDAENLVKAIGNKEWGAGKRLSTAAKELAKPAVYMLPPFGGGQIKKIWEGLKMIAQGGATRWMPRAIPCCSIRSTPRTTRCRRRWRLDRL